MSGVFFDNPGVRFSPRYRLFKTRMRAFALVLFRGLSRAARHLFRIPSRLHEAEFPAAMQPAYKLLEWTLRGPHVTDRASIDALRPNYNSVNTEDHYGISIIREEFAASARRRLPTQERQQSPLPAKHSHEGAGQKIDLAADYVLFHERKAARETGRTLPQRFGIGAALAQA
jgi:hypothetical protein